MTMNPLIKRSGSKRSKNSFLIFRAAALVVVAGVLAVFGFAIKNTLALTWSEPAVNPPSMTGINGPVWAQSAAAQAGDTWLTGKGRYDTAGTADANCTGAKVCGADNGAGFGLSGESATGVGLYASTGNAASYAGDFNGNVYMYPGSKLGMGVAPSYTLDILANVANGAIANFESSSTSATNTGITLRNTSSVAAARDWALLTNSVTAGDFVIKQGNALGGDPVAAGTTRLYVSPSGQIGIANTAPSALLTIGTAGTTLGTLSMAGNTSGVVTVQPAAAAGTWTLTLPTSAGTSGQVLQTNGAGVTTWATVSGGGQTPWTANEVAAGFTLYGNSTASGNMTIDSTSNATKGYIILQPSGGNVGIGNSAPTASLSLGTAGTRAGTLTMAGVTSGVVTLDTLAAAGTWTFTLPASGGTANQFLQTDGAGNATWASVCSGTCTANYMSKFGSAFAETNSIMYDSGTAVGISNTAPSALLTLGTAGTKLGNISFAGSTSGTVTVQPAAAAGTWTLTLPTTAGTSGYFLQTNGSGTTTWAAASASGITCGTCTTNYVTKFASASSISNSLIYDSGTAVGISNTSPSALLTLGTAGTKLGNISFAGSSSGTVTMQPAAAAGTWTLTLPTTAGSSGQYLQTNGSGTTTWATVSGGGGNMNCGGTCTAGYVPKFNSGTGIINSLIYDNGSGIGIGTTSPSYPLHVATSSTAYSIYATNGYSSTAGAAVYGSSSVYNGYGVYGINTSGAGGGGVYAQGAGMSSYGIYAYNTGNGNAVYAKSGGSFAVNAIGTGGVTASGTTSDGVDASSTSGFGLSATSTNSYGIWASGPTYGLYTPNQIYAGSSITSGSTVQGAYVYSTNNVSAANYNASTTSTAPYMSSGYGSMAQYLGNWGSSDWWGIGPNNGGSDRTVRIGGASSSGAWNGAGTHLAIYGYASFIYNTQGTPATGYDGGLTVGWNRTGGGAEVDFFNRYPGASTGYNFYTANGTNSYYLSASIAYSGAYATSDRRLKKDIQAMDDNHGLAVIEKLKPVTYQWKYDPSHYGEQLGLIAQEVQTVLPQVVKGNANGDVSSDPLTINYSAIIPDLIKGIQQLDKMALKIDKDGSVTVDGDLNAENNKWGTGSGWIECPATGECSCPNGSFITKIKDQGKEAYCNKI